MENLIQQLYAKTALEDLQKKTGKNINTMNLNYNRSIVPEIPQVDFFKYGNIAINKHSRFSYTPAHTHSFIEINYVLNGKCTQRLNGEKFQLETGHLVILDRKVIQQIDYVDSEDIIINMLLEDESIQNEVLPNLSPSSNLVTDFFLHAANTQKDHSSYIIFDTTKNESLKKIIDSLLLSAFEKDNSEQRLLINLLYCALMVSLSTAPVISTNKKITSNDPLIKILKYINDNYTEVTLNSLGQTFGYNKNYLSNLLKDKTGSSFQELIDQKRLSEAKRLMSETDDSLSSIAMKIGYKSVPSIFKLFQKETGQTPNFFRSNPSTRENGWLFNTSRRGPRSHTP